MCVCMRVFVFVSVGAAEGCPVLGQLLIVLDQGSKLFGHVALKQYIWGQKRCVSGVHTM